MVVGHGRAAKVVRSLGRCTGWLGMGNAHGSSRCLFLQPRCLVRFLPSRPVMIVLYPYWCNRTACASLNYECAINSKAYRSRLQWQMVATTHHAHHSPLLERCICEPRCSTPQ